MVQFFTNHIESIHLCDLRYTQIIPLSILVISSVLLILYSLVSNKRRNRGLLLREPSLETLEPEQQPLLSTDGENGSSSYSSTPSTIIVDPTKDILPSEIASYDQDEILVSKVVPFKPLEGLESHHKINQDLESTPLLNDTASITSISSQKLQEEQDKEDYAQLSAAGHITIVTVKRSPSEYFKLFVELLGNLLLVGSSVAAFFIPSIYKEWTSTDGTLTALKVIAGFWSYSLLIVLVRLYLIRISATPTIPLWAHSTTLYLFAFCFYLVTFRSSILHPYSYPSKYFNIFQSLCVLGLFWANFSAKIGDKPGKLYVKGDIFPSLEPISSIFSLITFSWIDPIIWKGYFHPLTAKDIWELRTDDHSAFVIQAFRSLGSTASLIRRLLKYFLSALVISNSWTFIYSLLSFAPPFLLKKILEFVDDPTQTARSVVWLYVVSFLICGIFTNIVQGQSLFIGRRICIRLRSILIGEIYSKTLRRRATTTKDSKLGKSKEDTDDQVQETDSKDDKEDKEEDEGQANHGAIINLMAVDTFKVSEICAYLHFISQGIFVVLMSAVFLYILIGWSGFVGIGSTIILMPIQYRISTIYSEYQDKLMAATDKRINKLNEVLQSIRIIKFFAWEEKFADTVMEIREEELKHLKIRYILWGLTGLVFYITPVIVTVLTFSCFIFIQKQTLTAPIAFTTLSILNIMSNPLYQLSEMINELLQAKVSLDRIDDFLSEKETSKYDQLFRANKNRTANSPVIGFEHATFSWESSNALATSKTDFKLRDLDISFKVGELNLIVGPTGSGKTSLLLALLGEMELVSGNVFIPGGCLRNSVTPDPSTGLAETIAYCSQSAWLLNDTLRNNILFGSEYDPERYKAVINACALSRDLEILDAGDKTEIGEKGITLSGGQKQRVSLARAFYSNSKHLILDDCLSAVDSHTALWIYENCLVGPVAKNRTIILVTHNVALTISQASFMVIMDNGRVKGQGAPGDMLAQGLLGDDELLTSASITRNASSANLQNNQNPKRVDPETMGEELARKLTAEPPIEIIEEEEDTKKIKSTKRKGQLIDEESKAEGKVSSEVYLMYMRAMGTKPFWIFLIVLYLCEPGLNIAQSWWIKIWTAAIVDHGDNNSTSSVYLYNTQVNSITYNAPIYTHVSSFIYNTIGYYYHQAVDSVHTTIHTMDTDSKKSVYYMGIYIFLGVLFAVFSSFKEIVTFFAGINASRKLFKKLLDNVLQSKIRFFDSTPIGRIMNRFSKDMEGVDQDLSSMASAVFRCVLGALSTTILIAYITPMFLVFACFIVVLYWIIGSLYLTMSREVKRIDSISKSPIYQHFGETLSGVSTIRAYGVGDRFIEDNLAKVDNNNRPFFYLWVANRWLSFRIDFAGSLVSFFAAAMIILSVHRLDAGLAGLSLSYALTFNDYVLWIVRLYAVVEMNMNSVERLQEYMNLDKEAPAVIPDSRPPSDWPSKGEIKVSNLSLRYAPDLPLVIKNVSFEVPAHSKIGIVGRTGAGKSTIITAFFRFLEADSGSIIIDGIDISTIGLRDLRQGLAIIPQDPTLFQGTIRSNLDPFNQYSDDEIFEALRRVHLIKAEDLSTIRNNNDNKNKGKGKQLPAATTAVETAASTSTATRRHSKRDSIASLEENANLFHDLSTKISEGGSNLSQGQRQLVCLARSLLKAPKVLLLDEATASIDYESDAQIQKTIRDEFSQTTILTIAHRLRSIADYDKILVMDAGRAVEYDHPYKLIEDTNTIFHSMCMNSGEFDALVSISREAWEKKKNNNS